MALVAALACTTAAWAADDDVLPADANAQALAMRNAKSMQGGGPLDPGAGAMADGMGSVSVDGREFGLHGNAGLRAGALVPDGAGDYVWIGSGKPIAMPSAEMEGAREMRLKVRELAAQLFEAGKGELAGGVTMPASFVNQDNLDSSSSFGRYIAEQLFYELNQLGVPVREYRTMGRIMTRPQDGEFALTRRMEEAAPVPTAGLVLTGTYYFDKHAVFVNARLYRPLDGMVLRTQPGLRPDARDPDHAQAWLGHAPAPSRDRGQVPGQAQGRDQPGIHARTGRPALEGRRHEHQSLRRGGLRGLCALGLRRAGFRLRRQRAPRHGLPREFAQLPRPWPPLSDRGPLRAGARDVPARVGHGARHQPAQTPGQ